MNKVILMGRLTKDPDVRYTSSENPLAIARYTLACDRKFAKKDSADAQTADFIACKAFGKAGEFAEKYFRKGTKIVISGRIETGSYTNKDGVKVYTTEVVVEEQEFAESKGSAANNQVSAESAAPQSQTAQQEDIDDSFMNIPDGIDEELPFN